MNKEVFQPTGQENFIIDNIIKRIDSISITIKKNQENFNKGVIILVSQIEDIKQLEKEVDFLENNLNLYKTSNYYNKESEKLNLLKSRQDSFLREIEENQRILNRISEINKDLMSLIKEYEALVKKVEISILKFKADLIEISPERKN